MKLLLHLCCGPCTIYPLAALRDQGITVTGNFYNPNIHPYQEFQRRLVTLRDYAAAADLPLAQVSGYGLTDFIRQVAFHEDERCELCYRMRLEQTAILAKNQGFDCFSTTLLYSRYQRHLRLKQLGETLSAAYGVPFFYQDFREGWQLGIEQSKQREMYRQPYCGCIFSEQERYDKSLRRRSANHLPL